MGEKAASELEIFRFNFPVSWKICVYLNIVSRGSTPEAGEVIMINNQRALFDYVKLFGAICLWAPTMISLVEPRVGQAFSFVI